MHAATETGLVLSTSSAAFLSVRSHHAITAIEPVGGLPLGSLASSTLPGG